MPITSVIVNEWNTNQNQMKNTHPFYNVAIWSFEGTS